jgi:Domain of unknown function (DUF4160)
MPTIAIVDGVALVMYINDHAPPHVHARFAEYRCKISIVTGEVINGSLPLSKHKAIKLWLEQHREEVSYAWEELRNGRTIEGMIK